MKILKALSLTFALGVLALAMLGAGPKSNVMTGTKSGRMNGELLGVEVVDAGLAAAVVDAGSKPSSLYMNSTKSGPMPLQAPKK